MTRSRDDLIADGVTVAGVDVGGMRADAAADEAARRSSARRSSARCAWPWPDTASSSPPQRSHLAADVDGMVDEALEREPRRAACPSRVWRGLTGREVDRELGAARELLARRGEALRAARAARRSTARRATPTSASRPRACRRSRRRPGLQARRAAACGPRSRRALDCDRRARARVRGHVKVVKPKVTTAELADEVPAGRHGRPRATSGCASSRT